MIEWSKYGGVSEAAPPPPAVLPPKKTPFKELLSQYQSEVAREVFGLEDGQLQNGLKYIDEERLKEGKLTPEPGSGVPAYDWAHPTTTLNSWRESMGTGDTKGNVAMRLLLAFTSERFQKQSDEKKVRITVNAQDLASFPQRIQGFSGTPPSIALHPRIVMDVDRNTGKHCAASEDRDGCGSQHR